MPLVAVMVNLAGISKGAEGSGTFAPSALPLANKNDVKYFLSAYTAYTNMLSD